jgi:hypothetical protein
VVRLLAGWRGQHVHAALRRRTWRSSNRVGGVDEERARHLIRFGEIEGALQGAPGGARVAEPVASDHPQQERCQHPDRRADGTSRNGTAVAGRSPCPGCGLATTSQISPAVRSPPDRADGLPLPCALDEESLIDAVMSVPRPQAYGACVVERAAQAHWRRPIPRPPGRWPGPAPGTAYGLCTAYLFGLVQLKQRRPGVPDREEQLGIGVAGAEPRNHAGASSGGAAARLVRAGLRAVRRRRRLR